MTDLVGDVVARFGAMLGETADFPGAVADDLVRALDPLASLPSAPSLLVILQREDR